MLIQLSLPSKLFMKLSLGTATFGQSYGILNGSSILHPSECDEILNCAQLQRIVSIDTAQVYGCSESIIGASSVSKSLFKISSKINIPSNTETNISYSFLYDSVLTSLRNLQVSALDTLYLHTYPLPSLSVIDDIVESFLLLKNNGLIHNLGVSLYTPDQIDFIRDLPFDVLQIPFSSINQSFLPFLISNQSTKRYRIRLRSIFLQGILLSSPNALRSKGFSSRFISHLQNYFLYLESINKTPLQYALGTALSVDPSEVIVGVYNKCQLLDICSAYRHVSRLINGNLFNEKDFAYDDPTYYDPRNWAQ